MRLVILSVFWVGLAAASWPVNLANENGVSIQIPVEGVPPSFDCAMRKLAYEYGKKSIPRAGKFESLYYALDLNSDECHAEMSSESRVSPIVKEQVSEYEDALIVEVGEDIQSKLDLASKTSSKVVYLRGGVHYLSKSLQLGPEHSGTTLASFPGEQATMSGGKKLNVEWASFNTSSESNIYVADIGTQVDAVPGLQLDGVRATRARYPNLPGGIEASCGYGCMVSSGSATWTPPDFNKYGPVDFWTDNISAHDRNDTANDWFKHYMIGVNGLCSVYDPPVSYWCSEHPSGGGAFAFRTPSGLTPKANALPNMPYKMPTDATFFVWRPARWANWMFNIKEFDSKTNNFTFGHGGFQGARGNNAGGDFFVENVMEELDSPGEFFFDKRAKKLYLYYNGTGAPPSSMTVVTPQLKVLVNKSGTQWNPVRDTKLSNIKFTATAFTYMDPHGVPSAGDWALDRIGAVYLQGTENVMIDGCEFDRLDGNGVMVSGYNRHATVHESDFSFIGGNAIAAWGYTNETASDPGRPGVDIQNYPQAGVDGTDGNHPRYTTIVGNTAREVGLYEKQSSFFVQAKTAESNITGNVFFNGPRAGINANDGFGGGDVISHNLVFSTCRESGDHGPFNSWDRQPFLTTVRDGTPSMQMKWREIHHNFFIDNYSPQENVDNDDGSSYYNTHDNFFVYGGNGMKNDFGGHDNNHTSNLYAYVGQAIGFYDAPMLDGHEDHFEFNKVILTGANVGGFTCTGTGKTVLSHNKYYTTTGNVTECKVPLSEWQQAGNDLGSSVAVTPSDDQIIDWARETLNM